MRDKEIYRQGKLDAISSLLIGIESFNEEDVTKGLMIRILKLCIDEITPTPKEPIFKIIK